jgi:hypothetical protein
VTGRLAPVVKVELDDDGDVRLDLLLQRVPRDLWLTIEQAHPDADLELKAHSLLYALAESWLTAAVDAQLGDPPLADETGDKVVVRMQIGDGPLEAVMDLDRAMVRRTGADPQRVLAEALHELADELDHRSGAYDAEGYTLARDAEEGE